MPYVKRNPTRNQAPNHEAIVRDIATELKKVAGPTTPVFPESSPGVPVIIEESIRGTDRVKVYVIWSKWSEVRDDQRTAAIYDAYEQVFGRAVAMRVIVAIGATPNEAKELGIES